MALATPELVNGSQVVSTQMRANQIPLTRLIDFAVQRTYDDLQRLAELLPSQSDMERKIKISQFACKTRQTFIRLLALVKWAGSASKVEKCSLIGTFLDRQGELFTLTADAMAKMSREHLVQARLPGFHIPAAVEVLTLGTYSRLPSCIREKIVPPDPVTPSERKATFLRLNQIIQQRLVTSALPAQMKNLKIENGRVTFHVSHEFELCLTLMGDNDKIPWKVLSVEILVSDKESGDGRDLVHPLQVNWLKDFVQTRIIDNTRPLLDAYNILHSFCLSLQLEVLHVQTFRLIRERLMDFIRIDEYQLGKKLSILYWREFSSTDKNSGMKFIIEVDQEDAGKPLQVRHVPDLGEKEAIFVNDAIKSDRLSVEKLFIHTTNERAKYKLKMLQKQLSELQIGTLKLAGVPPVLEVSFVNPCLSSERLLISVDTLTGMLMAQIPQFEDCLLVEKFPLVVKDSKKIKPWFQELRIWLFKSRCKKTVESLPVQVHEGLPFCSNNPEKFLSISSPSKPKLFFQFSKHSNYYLIVTFNAQSQDANCNETSEIELDYHLISTDSVPFDGSTDLNASYEVELPRLFLKINACMKLNKSVLVRRSEIEPTTTLGKRKLQPPESDDKSKKLRTSFCVPELSFLISFCEEKLAYGSLSCELHERRICHQVRVGTEPSFAHMIDIVQLPSPRSLREGSSRLQEDLLSSTVRLQGKEKNKIWTVTLCFCNCPIQTLSPKENGSKKTVYLMYDFANGSRDHVRQMVSELLEDWAAIDKLYQVVYEFGKVASNFSSIIDIKYFTYKKLLLGYGPDKNYSISVHWKALEKRFQLSFGVIGSGATNSNPHVIVAAQLQNEFNQHKSIATLIQSLTTTFYPLSSILNLSSISLMGTIQSRPNVPVESFCIIPQTSSHVRLIYRNTYCVDIMIQPDGLVAVRDGAFCLLDKSKVLEELSPIPGLKAFLNKFVDKNSVQLRRMSQNDDDNPPSPIASQSDAMMDQFPYSVGQMKNSPSVADQQMSRSLHHGVGLGSNPNTPQSPHTSMMPQVSSYGASPSTNFPLSAASPSNPMPAPSPSMSNLPDRSPAAIFNVNSPASHQSPYHMPAPSPGPSSNMQSPAHYMPHDHSQVNSPFHPAMNIHSPAGGGWPGSPSIPRPSPSRPMGSVQSPGSCGQPMNIGMSPQTPTSGHPSGQPARPGFVPSARHVPQRSWAAAVPTLLTPQGLDIMCKPCLLPDVPSHFGNSITQSLSQLDRFLGCASMRRLLLHLIQRSNNDEFQMIPNTEPGVVHFKTSKSQEGLQIKLIVHPTTMQLKIMPVLDQHQKTVWSPEELDIMERYAEAKVFCAPYKPNTFSAFTKLLNSPLDVLKDFIQLMKLELYPDKSLRWSVQWCLTVPPSIAVNVGAPGMSAYLVFKLTNILFYLQFTRNETSPNRMEPLSVCVPLMYDIATRSLKVPTKADQNIAPNSFIGMVNSICQRHMPYGSGCNIFMAINEILRSEFPG